MNNKLLSNLGTCSYYNKKVNSGIIFTPQHNEYLLNWFNFVATNLSL